MCSSESEKKQVFHLSALEAGAGSLVGQQVGHKDARQKRADHPAREHKSERGVSESALLGVDAPLPDEHLFVLISRLQPTRRCPMCR